MRYVSSKKILRRIKNLFELVRATPETFAHEKRVLRDLIPRGYSPPVVYDVGASTGVWSDCIAEVLPGSQFHLFEPLSEIVDFYKRDLQKRLQRRPNLRLHPIALGDTNGSAVMFVAQDGYGSSLNDRGDIPEVKARVSVPKRRLDQYVAEQRLPLPQIIKIDSQGAEGVILRGAGDLLKHVQLLFLECWLKRGYGPNTPLLTEITEWLAPIGFSPVEIGECFYDDWHRLYSLDVVFFAESFLREFRRPQVEHSTGNGATPTL